MEKTVNPITKFFQLTYNIFQIRYIVNIKLKKIAIKMSKLEKICHEIRTKHENKLLTTSYT